MGWGACGGAPWEEAEAHLGVRMGPEVDEDIMGVGRMGEERHFYSKTDRI